MAIQQHPLPQDISSYRFRLIGDMTIKQFAFLASFIIIGIVIYSSPIPFFFSYPLAFISVCLGIGIAFVPVQGRPLDQWIIAFIKSIYSPTQYTWRQSNETTQVQNQPSTPVPAPQTTQIPQAVNIPIPNTASGQAPIPKIPQVTQEPPKASTNTSNQQILEPETPKQPIVQSPTTQVQPITNTPTPQVTQLPAPNTTPVTKTESIAPTTNLPIPFTPTTPNTLVGLTLTPDGKILDNVMVEIQSQGLTIRATRSNRLGQFMFARPLENGLFQILAEKENFHFSAYSLQLTGAIVKPLKIQAE